MNTRFHLRWRSARNGDITLAVEDDRGRTYAGLNPEEVHWAYKMRDIVKTAYEAGSENRETKGFAIINREGRYDIAGLTSGKVYAGISKGLLGANRGQAKKLFEIVDFAYQRGQGIETPVLDKPPRIVTHRRPAPRL